jgi:hypothetical protein
MNPMVIELSKCEYIKHAKKMLLSSEVFGGGFPDSFMVHSNHTGRLVKFEVDLEAAINNEFWDGEMCEYIPTEVLPNCKRIVVHHTY